MFLVINNQYHYEDIFELYSVQERALIHLFVVNNNISEEHVDCGQFASVAFLKSAGQSDLWRLFLFLQYWRCCARVRKIPGACYAYSDNSFANSFILHTMWLQGRNIYLIRDAAFPTYVRFRAKPRARRLVNCARELFCRLFLRCPIKIFEFGGVNFIQLPDSHITATLVEVADEFVKNPIIIRAKTIPVCAENFSDENIVVLNERIYEIYVPWQSYVADLKKLLRALKRKYSSVFFKFHPNETAESRKRIAAVLLDLGVEIVFSEASVERICEGLNSRNYCSFVSGALLNLKRKGFNVYTINKEFAGLQDNELIVEVSSIAKNVFEIEDISI